MITPRPGGPDLSSLNSNVPLVAIPGINSAREAQYARRVKELEEEYRTLRTENEKNVCFHSSCCHSSPDILLLESYDCEIP